MGIQLCRAGPDGPDGQMLEERFNSRALFLKECKFQDV